MHFCYGISYDSLRRWVAFQRICRIQQERGPQVGCGVMARIVDLELEAIERATASVERQEALRPRAGR